MLTKEDVALLSQIFDEKMDRMFDEKLAPIHQEIADIKLEVADIRKENTEIKQELADIRQNYADMKREIADINIELSDINTVLAKIKHEEKITRGSLNSVLEWIDVYFRKDYPLPVEKRII